MQLPAIVISVPLVLAASLAHAQAPGEIAVQPVVMVPESACVACGCGRPDAADSLMSRRWAIGLAFGGMSLQPDGRPDDRIGFAIGELALRFRATRHFELELSVGGGRERTADDQDGELAVSSAVIAARWRFLPAHAWNWFVTAGIGGAAVARHDATDQERSDATQPLGMLGLGVERRFRHFAVQAEARAIAMGEKHHDSPIAVDGEHSLAAEMTTVDEKRAGGSLSIGVSYYF